LLSTLLLTLVALPALYAIMPRRKPIVAPNAGPDAARGDAPEPAPRED
jgi:hypothetical protein